MTAPTTELTAPLSDGWTYAPAPESAAVAAVKDRYLPFVDGTFVEGHGDDAETFNPGTAEVLATVSQSTDGRRRHGGGRRAPGVRGRVVADERRRTRPLPVPDRARAGRAGA